LKFSWAHIFLGHRVVAEQFRCFCWIDDLR